MRPVLFKKGPVTVLPALLAQCLIGLPLAMLQQKLRGKQDFNGTAIFVRRLHARRMGSACFALLMLLSAATPLPLGHHDSISLFAFLWLHFHCSHGLLPKLCLLLSNTSKMCLELDPSDSIVAL